MNVLPLFLLAHAMVSQQCVSERFEPGEFSAEEAFGSEARSAVADAWQPDWGRAIAFVTYSDSTGVGSRVLSERGDADQMRAIGAILEGSLQVTLEDGGLIRMLIHDGSDFTFRTVAEFSGCAPRWSDRSRSSRELTRLVQRFRLREVTVVYPMLRIDASGRVIDARIDEGSGSFDLDAAVIEAARSFRFEPARNEGIPVSVWLRFPVTLRPTGGAD